MSVAALAALVGTALLGPSTATAPPPSTGPSAFTARVDDAGIEQRSVPAGCFRMGTTDVQAADARRLDAPIG